MEILEIEQFDPLTVSLYKMFTNQIYLIIYVKRGFGIK